MALEALSKALTHKGKLPIYPKDHKVGMRVPKGGSSCSKCEYVDGQKCKEKHLIAWLGTDVIPAPTDSWCCDFYSQ